MLTSSYAQTATYWAPNGLDGFSKPVFVSPVQLTVRWENRQERFIDFAGEEVVSKAVVWFKQTVIIGGYLHLGVSAATNPSDVESFPIRNLYETPDLKFMFTERKAFL